MSHGVRNGAREHRRQDGELPRVADDDAVLDPHRHLHLHAETAPYSLGSGRQQRLDALSAPATDLQDAATLVEASETAVHEVRRSRPRSVVNGRQ